jgi:hypothetical protein
MITRAATDRHNPLPVSLVPFLPAHTRLDVIHAMLGDLETATNAGQRYVMGKVLTQFRDAASAAEPRLTDLRRRSIRNTLAQLAGEAERLLPDTEAFARGARSLAAALLLA